jgi:hypothetical protein
VLTAGALGLIVGVGLWYVAAGLLPRSAGDWIAGSLIGGSKWQAGETLMQEASPETWARMVRLYDACGTQATELCEAAIAVTDRSARARGRKECIRAGPLTSPATRSSGRGAGSMNEPTV